MKIAILLFLATVLNSFAQSVVVPNDGGTTNYATHFGNEGLSGPFGHSVTGAQQLFSATQFATLPEGTVLTGVNFRLDNDSLGSMDAVIPRFEMRLSTFSGPLNSWVPSDLPAGTIVFAADNAHFMGTKDTSGSINPFDVRVVFQTPFSYTPTDGSLIMYLTTEGVWAGGQSVDGQSTSNLRLWPGAGGLAIAQGGFIAEFTYSVVPEPSVWMLIVLGGLALGMQARRLSPKFF